MAKKVLVIVAHADDMAQIKVWAASVGKRAGFAHGEEFRRQHFGSVERWLPGADSLPDDVLHEATQESGSYVLAQ